MLVHHLRFTARGGQPELEPASDRAAEDFEAALGWRALEPLRRLVGAGCPDDGPNRAYTRLPGGSGLLLQISPVAGEFDVYDVLALPLPPGSEVEAEVIPFVGLAEERWPQPTGWGPVSREALADLARSHPEMLVSLLSDVRGLFATEAGPQILIGDQAGPVRDWIALLAGSLPQSFARALTFTTASSRPYQAVQQIVGLAPNPDFRFSAEELEHAYRVRGAGPGRCSPPASHPWASVVAAMWQAGRPELIHDSRLSAPDPFDVGRLAVIALLEGIALEAPGQLAAMVWLGVAENSIQAGKEQFEELARLAGRLAKDAAATLALPAGFDTAVRRAYLALSRRAGPESIIALAVQSGRVVLQSALADCAMVRTDPLLELGLDTKVRAALSREFEDAIREQFTVAGAVSCAQLEGAIELAESLGVDWSAQAVEPAALLTRTLLDRAGEEEAVFRVLDRAGDRLTSAVLHRLNAAAAADFWAVCALYQEEPAASRLRSLRLTGSTPLLQLAAAAAEPSFAGLTAAARFERLWNRFNNFADAQTVRVIGEISLPQGLAGHGLAVAKTVADLLPGPILDASGLGVSAAESLEQHAANARREDLPALASLAQSLQKVTLNPGHAALGRLICELNRLNEASQVSVPDAAAHLGPLLQAAPRSEKLRTLLLKLLVSFSFTTPDIDIHNGRLVHVIVAEFDGDLIKEYSATALSEEGRNGVTRNLTSNNDEYIAGRFSFWHQLATSSTAEARATGTRLLTEIMDPVLDRMGTKRAKGVADVLRRSAPPSTTDSWVNHCIKHRLMQPEQSPPVPAPADQNHAKPRSVASQGGESQK